MRDYGSYDFFPITGDLKFRAKEQELVTRLQEAENKLSELQALRQNPESPELTPEQEQELEDFRAEKVKIRKELRNVQFELRRDMERLQAWIKFINIGLVPILLALITLGLWAYRRKKQRGTKE
jgi:ABC-type uncharacterized transport system involved in gliding motility auxiliary subunit